MTLAICNQLTKELKEFLACISDRLIKLRLHQLQNHRRCLHLGSACHRKYERSILDAVPEVNRITLLGDFNARFGADN